MSLDQKKYQRSAEILFEKIDDETVILNLKDGVYYGLNSSAQAMWESLTQPQSPEDLCLALRREFPELNEAECRTDVDSFLQSLIEPGLVDVYEG